MPQRELLQLVMLSELVLFGTENPNSRISNSQCLSEAEIVSRRDLRVKAGCVKCPGPQAAVRSLGKSKTFERLRVAQGAITMERLLVMTGAYESTLCGVAARIGARSHSENKIDSVLKAALKF